jgi:hypothetical protein
LRQDFAFLKLLVSSPAGEEISQAKGPDFISLYAVFGLCEAARFGVE